MHVAKVVKSFTRATILKKILRNYEKYINIYIHIVENIPNYGLFLSFYNLFYPFSGRLCTFQWQLHIYVCLKTVNNPVTWRASAAATLARWL